MLINEYKLVKFYDDLDTSADTLDTPTRKAKGNIMFNNVKDFYTEKMRCFYDYLTDNEMKWYVADTLKGDELADSKEETMFNMLVTFIENYIAKTNKLLMVKAFFKSYILMYDELGREIYKCYFNDDMNDERCVIVPIWHDFINHKSCITYAFINEDVTKCYVTTTTRQCQGHR